LFEWTARTLIGIIAPRFRLGDGTMWIPDKPSRAASGKVVAGAFPKFCSCWHLKSQGVSIKEAESGS